MAEPAGERTGPGRDELDADELLEVLRDAELEICGRMPWSSNGTFLVELDHPVPDGAEPLRGVYKPGRGERPLWDFPDGLYRREVAAFELAHALGWGVVPPTVLRDGPLGEGSVQLFIDADFEHHYFTVREDPEVRRDLETICVLDLVANNTDRKSGHCLLGRDGRIYAIDNGLSFHVDPKLRTVIWDFGGEDIPDDLVEPVAELADGELPESLTRLLHVDECIALMERAEAIARVGRFPVDHTGRRHPWPLV
ncbi:MAG: SCO1664 family protein [Actinomycetota bacterium]|nr:SCO1664 family protein [Actinomycetota bacterium]